MKEVYHNNNNSNSNDKSCLTSANNLVLISTLISISIAQDMSVDDIILLATLLQAVGQNLSVIATSKQICEDKNTVDTNTKINTN